MEKEKIFKTIVEEFGFSSESALKDIEEHRGCSFPLLVFSEEEAKKFILSILTHTEYLCGKSLCGKYILVAKI